ncbi:MAG TPA: sialidase family protein [Candidatus Limnocylindria bacterium]
MKLRPALLAALALLVTACAADPGASNAPTTTPPPSSAPPSVMPEPSEAPEPSEPVTPPAVGFEPATVPDTQNSTATTLIARGGDGLVAIGFDGGFGSLLWTSGDGGRTWTDITPADFASIGIASVVEFDGMLVGVGRGDTIDIEAEQAAVYLSEDGTSWRKVETAEQLIGQMIDVVATEDGLFAVGGVPGADSAGIWHSTDAETWTRVGGDLEQAFLWSIAEGGPGLVAVGWRRNPEPDLAVWTSADAGQTWDLAPDPEGFAGHEATDVVALPDGTLAMTGSAFDGTGGRMWTSTDGVAWAIAHESPVGAYARSLVLTPAGVVGVGGDDELRGRAWISTDGVAWAPLGDPLEGAFFASAFANDDGLLLAGATQAGTLATGIQAHAAVWIATLED